MVRLIIVNLWYLSPVFSNATLKFIKENKNLIFKNTVKYTLLMKSILFDHVFYLDKQTK